MNTRTRWSTRSRGGRPRPDEGQIASPPASACADTAAVESRTPSSAASPPRTRHTTSAPAREVTYGTRRAGRAPRDTHVTARLRPSPTIRYAKMIARGKDRDGRSRAGDRPRERSSRASDDDPSTAALRHPRFVAGDPTPLRRDLSRSSGAGEAPGRTVAGRPSSPRPRPAIPETPRVRRPIRGGARADLEARRAEGMPPTDAVVASTSARLDLAVNAFPTAPPPPRLRPCRRRAPRPRALQEDTRSCAASAEASACPASTSELAARVRGGLRARPMFLVCTTKRDEGPDPTREARRRSSPASSTPRSAPPRVLDKVRPARRTAGGGAVRGVIVAAARTRPASDRPACVLSLLAR